MLRRTTALLALLILVGSIASAQRASAGKGGKGASLDAKLDLNKIVNEIVGTIGANKNRGAWVKSLLEQTKSRTAGKYNVMVFNMRQNYEFNPPAGTFKFAQTTFNGGLTGNITYGIWVFSSAATFTNKGDGGFINWAFYGAFTRNRGTVTFSAATTTAKKAFSHRRK
jgi:hypothetical protein